MTDGKDIGYVLLTDNNIKIWIFNSELNEQTRKEYKIEDSKIQTNIITKELLSRIDKVEYNLSGNRSIKRISNPFNLISWLIFTLKDIF
jgi:cytidylate kinase